MRNWFIISALVLGTSIPVAWATGDAAFQPSKARRDALINLVVQDCGSCHGLTMRGGLGPALLPSALEGRDDADLSEIILNGVPGTPMPPWGVELSGQEALWIARMLKQGIPK